MKLTCKVCGTVIDADKDTAEKMLADHTARFHENKDEQVKALANAAKSFAFQVAHGTVPKRKSARELVTLASQILNEPIPPMEGDESPATDARGGNGEPAAENAKDAGEKLQDGATSPESRANAAKAGAELNKKKK